MDGFVIVLFIVLVKVWVKGNFGFIEIYVFLDNGFNFMFCLFSFLEKFGFICKKFRFILIIMGIIEEIDIFIVKDLEVFDLDENVVIFLYEMLIRLVMLVVKYEILI